MKKILKSLLVLSIVLTTVAGTTQAWFTSEINAEDNQITTGTLYLAVDTGLDDTTGREWNVDAWNVAQQLDDGDTLSGNPFPAWENVAPGDTHSYYVGVRNRGTLPMEVRSIATGEWFDGPRLDECSEDAGLVSVTNIHQYASDNCEGELGCLNIYYALTDLGWDHLDGLSARDAMYDPDDGYYYGNVGGNGQEEGNHYLIDENQFSIYRVDVELSETADSCYQGATYHFDLAVEGQQADANW